MFKDKELDTSYIQSEQVLIKNNFIYGFDRQRVFRARYIAGNNRLSQEHKEYDEMNMGYKNTLLAKSK